MSFYTDDCKTAADVYAAAARVQAFRKSMTPRRSISVFVSPPNPPVIVEAPKIKPPAGKRAHAKPEIPSRGAVAEIIDIAADYFGMTSDQIRSSSRAHKVSLARKVAMYIASLECPRLSLSSLGRLFRRDHTTVLHDRNTIANALAYGNVEVAKAVKEITAELKSRQTSRPPPRPEEEPITPHSEAWTEDDEAHLRLLYKVEGLTAKECGRRLKRSENSVWKKIRKLGLQKNPSEAA